MRDAITDILGAASSAGLVTGIHAGDGKVGHAMAQLGFQMITLASESQALRRGAAADLRKRPRKTRRPAAQPRVAISDRQR